MQDLIDEQTQKVFEWSGAKKHSAAKVPVDGVLTTNDEQTSVLSLELPLPPRPERPAPHTILITVVDRSGSMRSYWNSQVVPALNSLAQIVWNQESAITGHVITYATTISNIDLNTRAGFQVRDQHLCPLFFFFSVQSSLIGFILKDVKHTNDFSIVIST
jgi:hypothetical protein